VHNYPATWAALAEGELTERAAFTIVSELSVLEDPGDLRAAEAAVLAWARQHPVQRIKQAARAEAAKRDAAAADKAHKAARDDRSVRMVSTDFGTADLIHSQDAAAVMTSLSRAALRHRRHGDVRSMDQLRADIALARLLPRTKHTTTPTPNTPADAAADATAAAAADAAAATTDVDTSADAGAAGVDAEASGRTSDTTADGTTADARTAGGSANADANGASADADGKAGGRTTGTPEDGDADTDVDLGTDVGVGDRASADGDHVDDAYAAAGAGAAGETPHDPDSGIRDDGDGDGDGEDVVDEATLGADARVSIHATGAELRALLDGDHGTGGELEGHGPIPQNALRKALIKALTQTLLPALPTSPTRGRRGARINGSRIEVRVTDQPPAGDPDKYTPSAALDRYVRLRDRTCRFPGCNRPAQFTDLDHRVAFAAGGRTTADNLHCLCRHHHRLKHEGNWTVRRNPDGSHTWTSPTGRQYRDDNPDP
jgi:hypothetical protein